MPNQGEPDPGLYTFVCRDCARSMGGKPMIDGYYQGHMAECTACGKSRCLVAAKDYGLDSHGHKLKINGE